MNVDASFAAEKMKIFRKPFVILPAADELADFRIKGLDADLELQRAGRKLGNDFSQLGGQPVGNHLEMIKISQLMPRQKKFQNCLTRQDVQVERAIHKLELLQAALQKFLHRREKFVQRHLPHRNVERRQTKFAGERTAARRLDIHDAVREVRLRVILIGQRDA